MCAAIASAATREPPPRFVRPLVPGVYAGCAVETRLSFAGSNARANYFRWRTLIEGACIEPELALVGCRDCLSVRRPRRERVELDRCGHAGDQPSAFGHLIDSDAHRDALSETHPCEDRVDGSQSGLVGSCVRDIDAPRDAGNLTSHNRAVTQQFNHRRIALVDGGELRFLEIGIHPEGIGISHRDHVAPNDGIVTNPRQEICDPSIHRRTNIRTLQIYLRLAALCAGLGKTRLGSAELRFQNRDLALGEGGGSLRILERCLILAKYRGRLLLRLDGSRLALREILVPRRLLLCECQPRLRLLYLGLAGADLRLLRRDRASKFSTLAWA